MKYIIMTLLLLTSVLLSSVTKATLISHNGYTLNTETKVVNSGSLGWLQWDQTQGLSIEHALALNSGWRLASTHDVANLYNDFFPVIPWSTNENFDSSYSSAIGADDTSFINFVNLFGHTSRTYDSTTTTYSDHSFAVRALFGGDLDNDGYFQEASVYDAYQFTMSGEQHSVGAYASMTGDEYDIDYYNGYTGVALVRDINSASVPEPATYILFLLGILYLVFINGKHFKNI